MKGYHKDPAGTAEAIDGEVTDVTPIRRLHPVADYLSLQGRFGETPREDVVSRLQAEADRNIRTFGLTVS